MSIRGRAREDTGLSLVELLVAMAVATVVLAGVGAVYTGVLRGVRLTTVKTATGADARLASEAITRTLKVATLPSGESSAFVTATPTGMSFYTLVNRSGTTATTEPLPTLVTYTWNSVTNCLTETITGGAAIPTPTPSGPSYTWAPSGARSKCLLRTSVAPAFSYYDSGDAAATPISTVALTSTELPTVRAVLVSLTAKDPANPAISGVPTQTRVALENLIALDG